MDDPRLVRLDEPHVKPLMDIVRRVRDRGLRVPNVDPEDGGVDALALFLLESPGPRAVNSHFVSRTNPDPSARNIGTELDRVGFKRSDVVLWNVVPHCISTTTENRNATSAHIREAAADTQAFIDALHRLRVVVYCGRKAQQACRYIRLPLHVQQLQTFHPGAMAYNHQRCRDDLQEKFKEAHWAAVGAGRGR